MTTISESAPAVATDEPTAGELIQRAKDLIPLLIENQDRTEQATRCSPEVHEAIRAAGLYRTLIPRRYGGYEQDITTFTEIVKQLARGCPSTAWGFCLAARHVVQAATIFPEHVQDQVLSAEFRAAEVAAPTLRIRKVEGGWSLTGTAQFASGIPYSTYYMGQALPVESEDGPPVGPPSLFIAPPGTREMVDDWGWTLGLRGSGSNSIKFDGAVIPDDYVVPNTLAIDFPVGQGMPGLRLHDNPIYTGRTVGPITLDMAALMTGMALGALDEYETLLATKRTMRPPQIIRAEDPDYQRLYGRAFSKLFAAEALIRQGGEHHQQACRDQADGSQEFTALIDLETSALAGEAFTLAWDAVQEIILPGAGTGAIGDGSRIQRIWRDMSTARTHVYVVQIDLYHRDIGQLRLLPQAD